MSNNYCRCGQLISQGRINLGYFVCLSCGDNVARQVKRTVVPMHKSNYTLITNRDELVNINSKQSKQG